MSERLHAGPRGEAGRRGDHRRAAAVFVVVAVLVAALGLAGYAYARSHGLIGADPTPTTSASTVTARPSATPGTTITLPQRFGDYERDDTTQVESPVDVGSDLATATAYYNRNGVRTALLVAATPVYDLEAFLLSLGLSNIEQVGDGFCGRYTGITVCAVLDGGTAVGAVPLVGQGRTSLVDLARQARAAM